MNEAEKDLRINDVGMNGKERSVVLSVLMGE